MKRNENPHRPSLLDVIRRYAPFLLSDGSLSQRRSLFATKRIEVTYLPKTQHGRHTGKAQKRASRRALRRRFGLPSVHSIFRSLRRGKKVEGDGGAAMEEERVQELPEASSVSVPATEEVAKSAEAGEAAPPASSESSSFFHMSVPLLFEELFKRLKRVEEQSSGTPAVKEHHFRELLERLRKIEVTLPHLASKSAANADAAAGAPKASNVPPGEVAAAGPDAFLSKVHTKDEDKPVRSAGAVVLEEDSKLHSIKSELPEPPADSGEAQSLLQEMNRAKEERVARKEIAPALPSDDLLHPSAAAAPKAVADKIEVPKKEEVKETPKVAEAPVPKIKLKPKGKGGLSQFLASLRYLGIHSLGLSFIQNLATMLNAGLPLVDSLKALLREAKSKNFKAMLQRVVDAVENGSAFWRALEAQQFFSPHAISLIRIGEEAGNLAENMEYLALQQEKDHALKSKVKMAMIYPSIVLVLMFGIVMGLGMFVLPNLIQVLFSLNVPLPLVTRIVIKFTNLFSEYGAIALPSIIGGVVVFILLAKFTALKIVVQWVVFKIPGVGKLAKEASIARFGVILGGLLQAGVPVVEALRSLAEVTTIMSYRKFYVRVLEHISIGDSFAKSFSVIKNSEKILPISVQQLVMTGERSGSLSKIMLKVADIYEKKANDTAQKLPIILEPMILLFIGALVGTIALAIIVPIYSIVGNVSGG